jgi:hypothetical protein
MKNNGRKKKGKEKRGELTRYAAVTRVPTKETTLEILSNPDMYELPNEHIHSASPMRLSLGKQAQPQVHSNQ